jgi:hypothetical protein
LQPGTRTVAGFDHQGSKRLRSHQPDVLTLLIGALLMSAVAVVKAQESDDTGASSAAVTAEQDGNTAEGAASNVTSDTARAVPPAAPAVTSTTRTGNFFQRFGKAYLADWQGTTDSGPEPKYRGFPAPVTNPPFPFAVWTYKGSVTIGYPWTQSGPLMQAIWSGKDGEAWKKSGIQLYGWINGGFNVRTSSNGHYANAPAAYYVVPNSIQPDQMTFYIERRLDTVRTDHFDWGFQITSLYGIDYRFTTSKGWFSSQLLGRVNSDGSIGNEYGYDMVMAYADLYFPYVARASTSASGAISRFRISKPNWLPITIHIAIPCSSPMTPTHRPALT